MLKDSNLFDTSPLTCDECRDLLDIAAGLTLEGASLDQELPGVARHIATCANCREEYESLVHILRTAPDATIPRVSFTHSQSPVQTPHPRQTVTWTIYAPVLTSRWLTSPLQALAREAQPIMPERRLLVNEVVETPWGLAGLEVTMQPVVDSPKQIEISVNVAFEQPPSEPVRLTLYWVGQTHATILLPGQSSARFTGIALDDLFDANSGQVKGDLGLSLGSVE